MVSKFVLVAFSLGFSFLMFTLSIFYPNPLKEVSDYKVYYGAVNDEIIEELGSLDLAIIEPHQFTQEQADRINRTKAITLGYISIMELEMWNKEFVAKVNESDYYYVNNEKVLVPAWNTYIMDISNPHYRQIIMEEIEEEIIAKGFQGIFLDTVGDIDDYFKDKPKDQEVLRKGYVTLLKEIKRKYPKLILAQNWGFDTYKTSSFPYIDGIFWEDFNATKLKTSKWSQNWISYFKEKESKGNLAVFTIAPDEAGKKYSEELGFSSYINENDVYNNWTK
ncbi:endo alpha-1,4 polygalactosaminidase [Cytobacillus suaedae]|nr:endo alpha-1,4 polygalactosaminidase [Cytobacillus suaedae]